MDYEVFLLTRMKEVYDRTGDNRGGRRRGPRAERPDRHVRRAHRRRRRRLVRPSPTSCSSRRSGSAWRIAVAIDATIVRALLVPATMRLLGQLELVDAGPLERVSGTGSRAPRRRSRRASDDARRSRVTRPAGRRRSAGSRCLAVVGCSPWRARRRADPRERPHRARPRPRRRRRRPRRRPTRSRSSCPRDDGPHDRLTEWWYYTGHLAGGRRAPVRLRVRHLPRGARRLPGRAGRQPPRDHRRGRRPLRVRPARRRSGRRWTGSPRTGRHAAGFDLSIGRIDRGAPATFGGPGVDDGRHGRPIRWRVARAGRGGRGRRCSIGTGPRARRSTPPNAGAPRHGRLGRLRRGRRLLLLLADRGWTRPARSSLDGRTST